MSFFVIYFYDISYLGSEIMDQKKVGKFITKLRKEKKLTQEELANKTGLSKSTISMYERGERFPSEQILELLADVFNVDMNVLLGKQSRSTYYLNPETARLAEEAANDPDMRLLLDAKRDLSPEDLQYVISLIKHLKNKNS